MTLTIVFYIIIYLFLLRKLVKENYIDLIIFLIVNFIISKVGIYLAGEQYSYFIAVFYHGQYIPSIYYLIFLIVSLILVIANKKYVNFYKRILYFFLIAIDIFIFPYIFFLSHIFYFLAPY